MKKIAIFLFFVSSIFAKDVVVKSDFEVFFPLFGKIGEANASLNIKNEKYSIEIVANSFGVAKFMSSNKSELYISHGFVENGYLVPTYFKSLTKNSYKSRTKEYFFNHETKSVLMKKDSFEDDEERYSFEENLSFYPRNDLTTLYFNLKNMVNQNNFLYDKIKTAGAEKSQGDVEIFKISLQELADINKLFEQKDNRVIKVIINQKIFASAKGELYLNLDKDYVCKEAILKDVILFGDIRAKLVNFTLKENR
ncbi:MAG: hypothetical protein HXX81_05870 [Campylobacterales bacterium]|nr:hypothetical protein [Campylobacterales bacterium]